MIDLKYYHRSLKTIRRSITVNIDPSIIKNILYNNRYYTHNDCKNIEIRFREDNNIELIYDWEDYEFTDCFTWDNVSKSMYWFCYRVLQSKKVDDIKHIISQNKTYGTNPCKNDEELLAYATYIICIVRAKAKIIIKYCDKYRYSPLPKRKNKNICYEEAYLLARHNQLLGSLPDLDFIRK